MQIVLVKKVLTEKKPHEKLRTFGNTEIIFKFFINDMLLITKKNFELGYNLQQTHLLFVNYGIPL